MLHLTPTERDALTDEQLCHAVDTQAARDGLDADAWVRLERVRVRLLDYVACEGMEWEDS